MPEATVARPVASPHWALLALEPAQACYELVTGMMASKRDLPRGDGHPVVIFPGLAAYSLSTRPLRQMCEELGYAAYDWGRGQNVRPDGDPARWFDRLRVTCARLPDRTGNPCR
jgi:hypothetical protein